MSKSSEQDLVLCWLRDNEDFTNQLVLDWLRSHPGLLRSCPTITASQPIHRNPSILEGGGSQSNNLRTSAEAPHYRRKGPGQSKLFMELVKDVIYPDDDTARLTHKILQSSLMLMGAERASFYLAEESVLVSRFFDVTESTTQKDAMCSESEAFTLPLGIGFAGEAALSGAVVNIPDARQDPRLDVSVAKKSGFKIDSILCAPAKAPNGRLIGVVELKNKRGGGSFTKDDEKVFMTFLNFCAVGLINCSLHAQSSSQYKSIEDMLELTAGLFENVATLNSVIEKIMIGVLKLLPSQACRVLMVDSDPPGACAQMEFSAAFEMLQPVADACPMMLAVPVEDITGLDSALDAASAGKVVTAYDPSAQGKSNSSVNKFSTHSLLCVPVVDQNKQSIAVIQIINKTAGSTFTEEDSETLQAFAAFCGLALVNATKYESVLEAKTKLSLALKVLSHHETASEEEVHKLWLKNTPSSSSLGLTAFSFDDLHLSEEVTVTAAARMFYDLKMVDTFRINQKVLLCWVLSVKRNYRPVAYHNWRHAFNVAQTMFAVFTDGGLRSRLSDLEMLALLMAAFCHDLDILSETKNEGTLANLYTASLNEYDCLDHCVMILSEEKSNILAGLCAEDYSKCIAMLKEAVLSTDLSLFGKKREAFSSLVLDSSFKWSKPDHRSLLRCVLMAACDVAAVAKPWDLHRRVMVESLSETICPQMEVDFITTFCTPLFQALSSTHSGLEPLLIGALTNQEQWLKASQKTASVDTTAKLDSEDCKLPSVSAASSVDTIRTGHMEMETLPSTSPDIRPSTPSTLAVVATDLEASSDLPQCENCSSVELEVPNSRSDPPLPVNLTSSIPEIEQDVSGESIAAWSSSEGKKKKNRKKKKKRGPARAILRAPIKIVKKIRKLVKKRHH